MTASIRRAAAASVVTAALAVSGCTAAGWVSQAPPAAGSQAELSSRDKARNVLFVVDPTGKGILVGTISTVDGVEVRGITYAPHLDDNELAQSQSVPVAQTIQRQKVLKLQDLPITVEDSNLKAGLSATVTFSLSSGDITLDVPVYGNDHKDFREVWQEATGN